MAHEGKPSAELAGSDGSTGDAPSPSAGADVSKDAKKPTPAAAPTEGAAKKPSASAKASATPKSGPPKARRQKPKKKKKTGPGTHPNNVRRLRVERMMSKAELARRAGLSVLTIDRVEKGYGCRMDTKRKILRALDLGLGDRVRVFGEEE